MGEVGGFDSAPGFKKIGFEGVGSFGLKWVRAGAVDAGIGLCGGGSLALEALQTDDAGHVNHRAQL